MLVDGATRRRRRRRCTPFYFFIIIYFARSLLVNGSPLFIRCCCLVRRIGKSSRLDDERIHTIFGVFFFSSFSKYIVADIVYFYFFFLLSSLLSTFAYRQWACFMLAWIAANWLNTRPRVYDMCVLCAFRYYCAVRCVPLLYAMFYLQSTLCTHTKPYTNDYYLSVEREYFNIIC